MATISWWVSRVSGEFLIRAARAFASNGYILNDEISRILEARWDLEYWRKFGLPDIADLLDEPPPGWDPNRPWPDPSPEDRIRVHDEILVGLLEIVAGDPHPQPNVLKLLRNREIRLAAAKKFSQRLQTALVQVNEEIARLEQSA
ncbi:MAG: hypothetical protein KJ077_25505 [Anaerolineae bacterium]|nr:hypothetical protein [Anaerolineae bacterium]